MAPDIRISDANWERLKKWAVPLEDDVDDALGKVLDAAESQRDGYIIRTSRPSADGENASNAPSSELTEYRLDNGSNSGHPAKFQRGRRRKGQKVAQAEYELPILEALNELGGKAAVSQVLDDVERRMKHLFSEVEYEYPPTGTEARWRNTARWARAALIQRGLIKAGSERGIWELTRKGAAEVDGKRRRS